MLDGAPTDHFDEVFRYVVEDLEAHGGLKAFRRLDGRVLIALDGSEHFCSRKIDCPHCSTRKRSDGEIEYFHSFVVNVMTSPHCARLRRSETMPAIETVGGVDGHGGGFRSAAGAAGVDG